MVLVAALPSSVDELAVGSIRPSHPSRRRRHRRRRLASRQFGVFVDACIDRLHGWVTMTAAEGTKKEPPSP